jgi:peptidylglycine monooxygenase
MIEPLVVRLHNRVYEVHRPWASDHILTGHGHVSDVATDSQNRLYAFNRFDRYTDPTGGPVIAVYEPTGKLVRTLDLPEISDGHGISIGPADKIIVVDRDRHVVHILDNDGSPKLTLGQRNQPGRPFNHPTSAKVGPRGDIFVADGYGNSQIHRFSPEGRLLKSWGSPGSAPGEFSTPHCIAFAKNGDVITCDRENNRIQLFDENGKFIREICDLFHPMAVTVDSEGMILVTDQIPRLSMFTPEGKLVGRCRPVLYGGHGMCLDGLGNIYLAELRIDRISRLLRV